MRLLIETLEITVNIQHSWATDLQPLKTKAVLKHIYQVKERAHQLIQLGF